MDGGQVSSGIRLQRGGARRGVAKVGYQLGHFRQCWFGSHTASGVLQMKIVPHSRERRDGFIMAPLFEVKKKIPLCEVSDRKSTRLNSSHLGISYAVFCL